MVEMNRDEALALLKENLKQVNMVKHCLAVEAIMRACAEELDEDKKKWGLLGLIHDIDYEKTKDDLDKHTLLAEEILGDRADEETIRAIKSHGFWYTGVEPQSSMEYVLVAADSLSGLIIAMALILPSKKLADVKPENIAKRYKEKDFARNCNRERIAYCEKAGISLERFFEISLEALQGISEELEL